MNLQTKQATAFAPILKTGGVLQRKCDCGQHTIGGGGCSECEKKKGTLQRKASHSESANDVPPIVHQVLGSPGQPLDAATRSFMEPRFGHDFSRVRVHADVKAAESAKAVNALAYTVGRDVVFDSNEYKPSTLPGKRLIAHELTHVVQQRETDLVDRMVRFNDGREDSFEREADAQADRVINGDRSGVQLQTTVGMSRLQRQPAGAKGAPSLSGGTASLESCDVVVKGRSSLKGVNLFFGHEVSTLSSAQQLAVADFVKSWRAAGANQEIILEGFASVDGPDDFNLTLSCARANTLKRELMSPPNSVPESRITTEAHGETDQFGSPSQNRRVTIVTLPAVKPVAPPPPSAPPSPAAPTKFPDKIMFWFHAFIPKTVKGAIPAPAGPFAGRTVFPSPPHPFHRNSCFETDDRGFDSTVTASSRVRVVGIVDTVARTLTSASLSDLTFEIDCTSGSLKCKETPSPSVSVSLIPEVLTPTGDFAIALGVAANDPCVTGSPDLTTRGFITVDRKARTFSFVGATTFYPAFEMYAAFGAGPITIFRQAPIIDSPVALLSPGANPRSDTVKF